MLYTFVMLRGFLLLLVILGACSRTPEPGGTSDAQLEESNPAASGGPASAGEDGASCVIPQPSVPPTAVASLEDCPDDPDGRPSMPRGSVTFLDAPAAPKLEVELALDDASRAHGLMFRPSLGEEEGMLFSFEGEAIRTFWMHNTCLALDLLFVEASGHISGILEQVPPWNDQRRSVNCPVKHVLEVRAGWARDHGVKPGQKLLIETPASQ